MTDPPHMWKIGLRTPIGQLLRLHPATASVFAENEIDITSVRDLSLERVLAYHSMHPGLFWGRLQDAMEEAAVLENLRKHEATLGGLNFVGKAAFFVRPLFCECVREVIGRYNQEHEDQVTFVLPVGGNHAQRDMNFIWHIEDIKHFPDMVCSVGLSNLFRRGFFRRFVATGQFEDYRLPVHPALRGIGLDNPAGGFVPYAVVPWIIMADLRRLSDRPLPNTWEDLLDPIYARSVAVEGSDSNITNVLPLYIFRAHGDQGLRAFARNVKGLMHPVNMIRSFDRNDDRAAALSVVPWTFVEACPSNEERVFIWPADGALTVPMYFLVKRGSADRMRFLTEYLAGNEFGQKCADLFCPSVNPAVDNHLPGNASFLWLGWDFIQEQPDKDMSVFTRDLFAKYWGVLGCA